MKAPSIRDGWILFAQKMLPPDISNEEMQSAMLAFHSGASWLAQIVMFHTSNNEHPSAEDFAMYHSLITELGIELPPFELKSDTPTEGSA